MKFLCILGFHDWVYSFASEQGGTRIVPHMYCLRCAQRGKYLDKRRHI